MSDSFAELYEKNPQDLSITAGTILPAQVIEIGCDWVTLDTNLKSESYVAKKEFFDAEGNIEINVGSEIDVYLEALEDGHGSTRLSREKAKKIIAWEMLEAAYKDNTIIEGFIQERVNGGFAVKVGVIEGFLPGSLIDIRPVPDPTVLEHTDAEFKIVKIDYKRENIVVSRRAALEEKFQEQYAKQLEELKEGLTIEGIVKNITDYGAFVNLGIIDGLLHITDISWKRVKHPSDALTVGDKIMVKILKFEPENRRVSLGMKQLADNPWTDISQKYQANMKVKAQVTNIADYGCFAQLEDGIEGLIHVSEMNWSNKNTHPEKTYAVEDEIEVMILEVNEALHRISLSIKRCLPNPWTEFANAHKVGDKITAKVKSLTNFGLFISLTDDIDGLIHNSDISWEQTDETAASKYKAGDEVESVILTIDEDNCRVALGIKQLVNDPFMSYVDLNPQGTIVPAKISRITEEDGTIVTLADNLETTLSVGKKSTHYDKFTALKEGDSLDVLIMRIDDKKRSIKLSIDTEADTKQDLEKASKDTARRAVTLGDLIKEQMDN